MLDKTSPAPTANQFPAWVESLLAKYRSGVAHSFILHFNVRDYVVYGVSLKGYITRLMANREIVLFYDRSAGITFSNPTMEKKFRELVGLTAKPAAGVTDPAIAALLGQSAAGPQEEEALPRNPSAALPLIEKLLHLTNAENKLAAVVIDYAETLAPAADISFMSAEDRTTLITLTKWGSDPLIAAAGNPVFLLTNNITDLSSTIRAASSKYEAIKIPLPDKEARAAFIETYQAKEAGQFSWDVTPESLTATTAGLSLLHIEDVFLRAAQESRLTPSLVKERKEDIIRSEFEEVLELTDPRFGFEAIGGLAHVKKFFLNNVITPVKEGRFNRVPMGVMMTGPAGTGKSAVAEAVAKEAGVNAVKLNLARIFQGLVGASERNLEKALSAIDSLTPCIVFIDEIDQTLQRNTGGGGDSGVSSRIFQRIMIHASDTAHRGKVIYLAATNRPDLIDPALKRPGRFDKSIPFLVPDESERAEIILVMARRYGLSLETRTGRAAAVAAQVAGKTEGYTGAEIEALVIKANEIAGDETLDPAAALQEAVTRLSPSTESVEFMTAIAIKNCNDSDLLPPRYREALKDKKALDLKIEALRPAESAGRGRRDF